MALSPVGRARWDRRERWLSWFAWLLLAAVLAGVIWWPSGLNDMAAILVALAAMGLLALGIVYQVWHFRRWTLREPVLWLVWILVAAVEAWPLVDPTARATTSLYWLWQMNATFVLWAILGLQIVRRDTGLKHFVVLLTLMTWSLALASLMVGGPPALLLLLVTAGQSGQIWWLNTLQSGLTCIGPLGPLSMLGWFAWRLGREWFGSGAL